MENPFEAQTNKPQRPTFLLVLCILTFINSGMEIISSLFSVLTTGLTDGNMQMESYYSMINNMDGSGELPSILTNLLDSTMEIVQATAIHAREIALMEMVLWVIILLGAILMFQLRRIGFYLYATAQILMLFVLPYFTGFSGLVIAGMLFSAFFTIIFIVMYGLNLKHMK